MIDSKQAYSSDKCPLCRNKLSTSKRLSTKVFFPLWESLIRNQTLKKQNF